jgi:hypothetical protein
VPQLSTDAATQKCQGKSGRCRHEAVWIVGAGRIRRLRACDRDLAWAVRLLNRPGRMTKVGAYDPTGQLGVR